MLGLHNILLISQPTPPSPPHPPPSPPHHRHFTTTAFWGQDDDDDDDSSLRVCRDCGNRAKKECTFTRCRTCCKTRAFDCPTHVRSTWVPASKRRDRHRPPPPPPPAASSSSTPLKRPRPPPPPPSSSTTSSSNDLSLGISSHPQDSKFKKSLPGRIEAPAVFRNIKVMDLSSDGEAENAYVATVNISGHVFKGLLYDHGAHTKNSNIFPCVTKLHIDNPASTTIRFRDSSATSPPPIVDPSSTYTATSAN